MISNGKKVMIAYDLTVSGRLVRSVGLEKPFRYVQGRKELPSPLQKALRGLRVGDRKEVELEPRHGFGLSNAGSIIEMPKARFSAKDHVVGKQLSSPRDGKFLATVVEVRKTTLMLDFNHPHAGKRVHYSVLVVAIEGEGQIQRPVRKARRVTGGF